MSTLVLTGMVGSGGVVTALGGSGIRSKRLQRGMANGCQAAGAPAAEAHTYT